MITDKRLKPCPFCGKSPMICVCDNEGNIHDDDYVKALIYETTLK